MPGQPSRRRVSYLGGSPMNSPSPASRSSTPTRPVNDGVKSVMPQDPIQAGSLTRRVARLVRALHKSSERFRFVFRLERVSIRVPTPTRVYVEWVRGKSQVRTKESVLLTKANWFGQFDEEVVLISTLFRSSRLVGDSPFQLKESRIRVVEALPIARATTTRTGVPPTNLPVQKIPRILGEVIIDLGECATAALFATHKVELPLSRCLDPQGKISFQLTCTSLDSDPPVIVVKQISSHDVPDNYSKLSDSDSATEPSPAQVTARRNSARALFPVEDFHMIDPNGIRDVTPSRFHMPPDDDMPALQPSKPKEPPAKPREIIESTSRTPGYADRVLVSLPLPIEFPTGSAGTLVSSSSGTREGAASRLVLLKLKELEADVAERNACIDRLKMLHLEEVGALENQLSSERARHSESQRQFEQNLAERDKHVQLVLKQLEDLHVSLERSHKMNNLDSSGDPSVSRIELLKRETEILRSQSNVLRNELEHCRKELRDQRKRQLHGDEERERLWADKQKGFVFLKTGYERDMQAVQSRCGDLERALQTASTMRAHIEKSFSTLRLQMASGDKTLGPVVAALQSNFDELQHTMSESSKAAEAVIAGLRDDLGIATSTTKQLSKQLMIDRKRYEASRGLLKQRIDELEHDLAHIELRHDNFHNNEGHGSTATRASRARSTPDASTSRLAEDLANAKQQVMDIEARRVELGERAQRKIASLKGHLQQSAQQIAELEAQVASLKLEKSFSSKATGNSALSKSFMRLVSGNSTSNHQSLDSRRRTPRAVSAGKGNGSSRRSAPSEHDRSTTLPSDSSEEDARRRSHN